MAKLHPAMASFRAWHPVCNAYCSDDVHAIVAWFREGSYQLDELLGPSLSTVYGAELIDVRDAPEAPPPPVGKWMFNESGGSHIVQDNDGFQPILVRFRVPAGVI
jgi:hypothetical protein